MRELLTLGTASVLPLTYQVLQVSLVPCDYVSSQSGYFEVATARD